MANRILTTKVLNLFEYSIYCYVNHVLLKFTQYYVEILKNKLHLHIN